MILLNSFTLKHFLFCATNIVKNSDESKYVHSGYEMVFDAAVSWSFGNEFVSNVVVFVVGNRSSSHPDNCKNNTLVLDKRPIDDIIGSIGTATVITVICLLMEKKSMI